MRTFEKLAYFSRAVFHGIAQTGILALGFVSLLFAAVPIISTLQSEPDTSTAHADAVSCSCTDGSCSCDGSCADSAGCCSG